MQHLPLHCLATWLNFQVTVLRWKTPHPFFIYSFQRSALLWSGRTCKDHCPSCVLSHLLSSTFIYWTCPMVISSSACLVLNVSKPLWEETSRIWHVPLFPCFHRITEKLRMEGTTCHHLSLFWEQGLRFGYPGPCQAKSGVFPVKQIPPLLWATISSDEFFSQWVFFFLYLDGISPVVTCAHCLLSCWGASLWRQYFPVPLTTSLKLPFGC